MPLSEQPSPPLEDLEDLYENAPCGYLSLDPSGRIIKSNHTLSRWLGFSQPDLLGRKFHDLLNTAGRIFYETHFAPLLRMQGHFDEVALDLVDEGGSKVPVLANAMEKKSPGGDVQFYRLTIFRATDRRRYERDLVEARVAAEKTTRAFGDINAGLEQRVSDEVDQRMKAEQGLLAEMEMAELREQFIAVLGHDLRNPVASVTGGIRLLQKEELSARGQQILKLMHDSTRRMSGLINNVLDFARGRLGGGFDLNLRSNVPLESLVNHIVAELLVAQPEAIIRTSFMIDEPIACDPDRLEQLLSNLLGNAITHGKKSEPISLHAQTHSGVLEIWIANAGEPIPNAGMEKLFQPFFRGDVRDSQHGLGLGLHIASEIAKAHGGTLSATSSPEETRFTLRMPARQGRAALIHQGPTP